MTAVLCIAHSGSVHDYEEVFYATLSLVAIWISGSESIR